MDHSSISTLVDDIEKQRSEGRRKIDWARQHMPILESLRDEYADEQPLEGERIGMALHVEAKTANLVETLAEAGAEVAITGCNPLSTHDDVSVALDQQSRVTSYAKHGV
ncbi:MAG: adenosylhomocysteinase, partial [Halobacteriaceae archaeon]